MVDFRTNGDSQAALLSSKLIHVKKKKALLILLFGLQRADPGGM